MSEPASSARVLEAALDVAIERMCALHRNQQVFIFGPEGTPFWAREQVTRPELDQVQRALALLEKLNGERQKPFSATAASGLYTVFALDEQGDLFAIVLLPPRGDVPAEARAVRRQSALDVAPEWLHLRGTRSS